MSTAEKLKGDDVTMVWKCNTPKGDNMKLYKVTSPSIGPEALVVKAKDKYEASQVAHDVIDENRWTTDVSYTLYITELVQPENDGHGYCYPSTVTKYLIQ